MEGETSTSSAAAASHVAAAGPSHVAASANVAGPRAEAGEGALALRLDATVPKSPRSTVPVPSSQRWMLRDRCHVEKTVNVLTCAPFLALSLTAPKSTAATKCYAASTMGLGLVATAYHASGHDEKSLRKALRWCDHLMVAASSLALTRAMLHEAGSPLVTILSLACLPLKPGLVTGLHWGIMEVSFLRRVKQDPSLTKHHKVHCLGSLAALGLLVADKFMSGTSVSRFIHSVWHVVAAWGMHTVHALMPK